MKPKKILVLNGHPGGKTLSSLFTETYVEEAEAQGHAVRKHVISEMEFDIDFGDGDYKNQKPLEPELERFLEDLEWADHIVVSAPMWWGGLPAKLKGLFDRVLLPGRAFNTRVTRFGMPTPMLPGRTARVILTSDTPGFLLRLMYHRAILHQTAKQIFAFIGIKPTRYTYFSGATHADSELVARWVGQVRKLGGAAA